MAPLGAGGMGEVYRARDTRLDRAVAIKILPQEFSADAERRQRLIREARSISALSHPNICTLYDVGQQDGTDYLVLELLEGETLAERLGKGALPTSQVLRIGHEIAAALQRAHSRGLVHRDLKPGNVMLTKAGAKLLDFGLAKAAAPLNQTTDMPTVSRPLTGEGQIVGTFQYMSPEQVEGKEVDARSDIFSLGAMLHEMATGRRAFEGQTQASVAAAILEREPPPISALAPVSPPGLDRLVRACLAKDPDKRWHSAYDVGIQLEWLAVDDAAPSRATERRSPNRERLAWGAAAACLLILLALVASSRRRVPPPAPLVRSSLLPTGGASFVPFNFAISPDGSRLAYVAAGADGRSTLWIRVLSAPTAQEISGTDNATCPFWAPDSRRIGFFAEGKLKTVDAGGGPVRVVCDAEVGRGGTWNREGTIVFAPSVATTLYRVAETGGDPVSVTPSPPQGSGHGHRWPSFLPDARHFVYFSDWSSPGDPQRNGIYIGSVDGGPPKLVSSEIRGNVEFASGRLLYVRDRSLMGQPFDTERLEFSGPAQPIAEQEVIQDIGFHHGGFSVSQAGMLVIQSPAAFSTRLLWFDRSGKEVGQVPGVGYWNPRLSPDGRLLLAASDDARNGRSYIHVIDLQRGVSTRVTEGGIEATPVWFRDGKRIAYTSLEGGSVGIYELAADSSSPPQLLTKGSLTMLNDVAPDDRVVYMDFARGLPFIAMHSPAKGEADEFGPGAEARISPDGKWIARIMAGGVSEIFVQPFPDAGKRIQVSQGGGSQPAWRQDGREVFYIAPDRKLMAAAFDPSQGVATAPRALFQTHIVGPTFVLFQWDLAPDGRFLINSLNPDSPLTLIANWPVILSGGR